MTQRVKANLFYRGLTFHRFPVIGDTLYTRTEVVGLRANSVKPGRPPTGMAALRMTTIDQADQLVLDFYRCAMLPASPDWAAGVRARRRPVCHRRRRGAAGRRSDRRRGTARSFRRRVPGPHFDAGIAGAVLHSTGDVVSSAPELARLTLNIAATHHDSRVGGQRLVYGGHTIGLAFAQANRLLPNLVTVLGWQSCDHTGPVREGDTLYSELHVESAEAGCQRRRAGAAVAGLRGRASRTGRCWTGASARCSSNAVPARPSLAVQASGAVAADIAGVARPLNRTRPKSRVDVPGHVHWQSRYER